MFSREETVLTREVDAIQIPDGTPTRLPAGTPVMITQSLGDTYTVMPVYGGMFRIDGRDADALGKEPVRPAADSGDGANLEERVWNEMRRCYDPEIPVNIVDLGLVYDCTVAPHPDGGDALVTVRMTLTAPGCGMGEVLAADVRRRVEGLPGVREADVEIVFDPPWNKDMMTEAAKLQLGFF
jgi:probable FeS assembly SUF system protein SufT